jgi:hypothetical protein
MIPNEKRAVDKPKAVLRVVTSCQCAEVLLRTDYIIQEEMVEVELCRIVELGLSELLLS